MGRGVKMPEIIKSIPYAIIIIGVFYALSVIIDKMLTRVSTRYDTSASEIFRLLSNSQKALLLIVGSIIAIGKLGFDVSALVAGLGLSGFALGFALKDAISNLVTGIMIVIYKPFEIGSELDIAGSSGTVTDINLRYITIKAESGLCLVPNSLFLNNKLILKNSKRLPKVIQ
jgi:small conductance mechanosensitive channel